MKHSAALGKFGIAFFISVTLAACAEMGATSKVSLHKEELLIQAGFKSKTVTTEVQKRQLAALSPNKVSAVAYKGKLYYAYPDVAHNQVYVGRQPQYNTYRQLLQKRVAGVGENSAILEETAGPHRVVISQFNGWGPLND